MATTPRVTGPAQTFWPTTRIGLGALAVALVLIATNPLTYGRGLGLGAAGGVVLGWALLWTEHRRLTRWQEDRIAAMVADGRGLYVDRRGTFWQAGPEATIRELFIATRVVDQLDTVERMWGPLTAVMPGDDTFTPREAVWTAPEDLGPLNEDLRTAAETGRHALTEFIAPVATDDYHNAEQDPDQPTLGDLYREDQAEADRIAAEDPLFNGGFLPECRHAGICPLCERPDVSRRE